MQDDYRRPDDREYDREYRGDRNRAQESRARREQAQRRRKKSKTGGKALIIAVVALLAVIVAMIIIIANACGNSAGDSGSPNSSDGGQTATEAPTEAPTTIPESHMIEGVPVITQSDLKAGCETYACTMLLQKLGFNVDEHEIADNYLNTVYIYTGDDGVTYGPDMHSAFAGSPYAGWGVYAPSMAKSMNAYLKDQKSNLVATAYEGISLPELCEKYIVNDIPVMVWATTDMQEPYVFSTWTVSYVDENAKAQIGDEVEWLMHEHCMVLIGYDKDNYYFSDSVAGDVSVFERKLSEKRYEELGTQCIVVQ